MGVSGISPGTGMLSDASVEGLPKVDTTIQLSELTLEKKVSKGGFGEVWRASYLGTDVAVKKIQKPDDAFLMRLLTREVSALKYVSSTPGPCYSITQRSQMPHFKGTLDSSLAKRFYVTFPPFNLPLHLGRPGVLALMEIRHPNICQFLGVCFSDTEVLLVTEFVDGGTLWKQLKKREKPLPWHVRLHFAVEVAKAMTFLHAKNIMHRDLKSENILVDRNNNVKICDFGLSRGDMTNESVKYLTKAGTETWMAPEIIIGAAYSIKADIFSFGVVLYELIVRDRPPDREPINGFTFDMATFSQSFPPDCPPELSQITLACVSSEPEKRPSALELLNFLKELQHKLKQELRVSRQLKSSPIPPPIDKAAPQASSSPPPTSSLTANLLPPPPPSASAFINAPIAPPASPSPSLPPHTLNGGGSTSPAPILPPPSPVGGPAPADVATKLKKKKKKVEGVSLTFEPPPPPNMGTLPFLPLPPLPPPISADTLSLPNTTSTTLSTPAEPMQQDKTPPREKSPLRKLRDKDTILLPPPIASSESTLEPPPRLPTPIEPETEQGSSQESNADRKRRDVSPDRSRVPISATKKRRSAKALKDSIDRLQKAELASSDGSSLLAPSPLSNSAPLPDDSHRIKPSLTSSAPPPISADIPILLPPPIANLSLEASSGSAPSLHSHFLPPPPLPSDATASIEASPGSAPAVIRGHRKSKSKDESNSSTPQKPRKTRLVPNPELPE